MLEIYRDEIDKLDSQIIDLFEKRMQQVAEIIKYKKANHLPIFQEDREQKVLENVSLQVKNLELTVEVQQLFTHIMGISKEYQGRKLQQLNSEEHNTKQLPKIAFQGEKGAFGEQALKAYFGNDQISVNYKQFFDVFVALQTDSVNYGVLPLENSYAGAVNEVYDLLSTFDVYIIGEIQIPIHHHLLGTQEAKFEDIKEVYSHPQAIQQCYPFLSQYPHWEVIPDANTATSAKRIKESNHRSKAAIASHEAAKLYGLQVIRDNIHSSSDNRTRFIVISHQLRVKEDAKKMSLLFTCSDDKVDVHDCLGILVQNGLRILKIDSRPTKKEPLSYHYFVDIKGNIGDPIVQHALVTIKEKGGCFKMLGNY